MKTKCITTCSIQEAEQLLNQGAGSDHEYNIQAPAVIVSYATINANNIQLELTPAQAKVLHFILCNVGGSPDGPRNLADQIRESLTNQRSKFQNLIMDINKDSSNKVPNAIYIK